MVCRLVHNHEEDSQQKCDNSSVGRTGPADASRRSSLFRNMLFGWPLKAAFSLGLILLFASTLNWGRVVESLLATNKFYLIAAFAVLALTPPLTAERWRNAGLASSILLSRRFFLWATYAAVFAGQFLPASVGVDTMRLALLWQQRLPLRTGLLSIAVDRLAGVTAILVLMFAGIPFAANRLQPDAAFPMIGMAVMLAGVCGSLLFIDRLPFPEQLRFRWPGRLLSLVADTRAAISSPRAAAALVYAIILHLLSIFAVLLLAHSLGYPLQFLDLLTVVSFAIFAALLPLSFNGWGVREGAMMLGLSLLAVHRDAALIISFLYGMGLALASLPGSVSWYQLKHLRSKEESKNRSTNGALF
jgi:uncharacterized membrane protein YbhN (UPF0104 family)